MGENKETAQEEERRQACCLARVQANTEAYLRPAVWIPGIRALHQFSEEWRLPTTPLVCVEEAIQSAVRLNQRGEKGRVFQIRKVVHADTKCFVEVLVYSSCSWLSVIEIIFERQESDVTLAHARSFSSGMIPICCPLGFCFNMLFTFIPFYDFGSNRRWLQAIRMEMPIDAIVLNAKRKW